MVIMIIPECHECKTAKNVIFDSATTDDKTTFLIAYCTKCYSVMECSFRSGLVRKDSSKTNKEKQ